MAVEKKLKTRIIQKHETEEHWNAAEGFIPLEGEVIIYDPDNNHKKPRIKIGDGILNPETGIVEGTNVNDLPFITDSNLSDGTKNKAVYQKSEKTGDPELSFGFTDLVSRDVEVPSGTHNRETETGINAISLGTSLATGKRSFAMGSSNIAGGDGSTPANVAMGKDNYAKGDASFALGYANYTEGNFSMASGQQTQTIGEASHTEGNHTKAIGDYSHAEGLYTITKGVASHAEGGQSYAKGNNSHAEGEQTYAEGENSHAEGRESRARGNKAHAEGYCSHAGGESSHAEGYNTIANGINSHSEGGVTKAIGDHSHAEGQNTEATGDSSHAEGIQSKAIEYGSHAEGYKTEAKLQAHAEGNSTKAYGNISHAEGFLTKTEGEMSHAEGYSTEAIGKASHASGVGTVASAYAQTTVGRYNKENSDALFIVGNGTSDTDRSNAFVVKQDGTVFANEKELSTKEYVDSKIAKSNKSLVFNTKENLEGFINGTTNLYCLETRTDVYTPKGWCEDYGGVAGSGGIQGYNLPEGIYTVKVEANGSWSEMSLDEYIISSNSDGTITYSIPAGGAEGNWVWWQHYDQNETITLTMTVQIVKGNSIKIKTEYFEREDGIAKENLNIGDLLLVKEENVPDYYWNGNEIVELEISLPENIVTKEELSNKISFWQPNTEYKVGDVCLAIVPTNIEYFCEYQLIDCVEAHISSDSVQDDIKKLRWLITFDGIGKSFADAYGNAIHEHYATKEELEEALENIPTSEGGTITVDQIYNPESENAQSGIAVAEAVSDKQDSLVSGTNIKTINNQSILGSGNITIEGDKGEKGDKGDTGLAGYTPIKGTDYWTDTDKTDMLNDVLAALPTWNGGSY